MPVVHKIRSSVRAGLLLPIFPHYYPVFEQSAITTMVVNSAGPNLKDDMQDTNQPHQQVDSDAVSNGIVEAALTLHPAAAVFRDEILGNVGARNKALEENNARIRHLVDLIQEVELGFYTRSSRRGQGGHENNRTIYVELHETFKLKHQLNRGGFKAFDNEERLVLPIDDSPAHPLEDCGYFGSVNFMLAGAAFGSFPSTTVSVMVEEDGSVRLMLHLSKHVVLEGKLHSPLLSNEELIECMGQPNFMTFLRSPLRGTGVISFEGAGEYRKGIVFTPLAISIEATPWLRKTLALVDRMSSPHGSSANVELGSDDELRRLVVEALGDSEHKELLSEYVALKSESNALCEIRNMMLGVNVRHSRGSFTVSLDEGKRSGNFWRIALAAGDGSAITVSELSRMEVSVLGMQLHLGNSLELTYVSSLWDNEGNAAPWFMRFEATRGSNLKFYMVLRFNWAELDDEEVRKVIEDYSLKMMSALGLRKNNGASNADTDAFPSSFKGNVVGLFWKLTLAEHRLKMAGLWHED